MRATAFKRHSIEQALTGLVRDHHRCVLMSQLGHLDFPDEQIDALSAEITRILTDLSGGDPASMLAALS